MDNTTGGLHLVWCSQFTLKGVFAPPFCGFSIQHLLWKEIAKLFVEKSSPDPFLSPSHSQVVPINCPIQQFPALYYGENIYYPSSFQWPWPHRGCSGGLQKTDDSDCMVWTRALQQTPSQPPPSHSSSTQHPWVTLNLPESFWLWKQKWWLLFFTALYTLWQTMIYLSY